MRTSIAGAADSLSTTCLHCSASTKSRQSFCCYESACITAGTGKNDGDRHPKISDNVLIGAAATILGNITVGKGAMVAAGSLVLKPVPPRTMVAGTPAKEVGKVTGTYKLATVRKPACGLMSSPMTCRAECLRGFYACTWLSTCVTLANEAKETGVS